VIPTYNEHENLPELVNRIQKAFSYNGLKGHLIIVDDNSPDGTGELAEQLADKCKNITVIHRPAKLGLGGAYCLGFQTILDHADVDVIIQMDADLSHDPESISIFVEQLKNGVDVVVGSRYIPGGDIEGWPVQRRITSEGANFFVRKLLGLKTHDITSGFRAYRFDVLKSFDFSKTRSNDYAFQVEMLYHCKNAGFRIGEVPITFRERRKGNSKLGKGVILDFIRTIVEFSLHRILQREHEEKSPNGDPRESDDRNTSA